MEPVVVPVQVDTTQAAGAMDTLRRARDAAGGPGAPAGTADAAGIVSTRALMREFQLLEGVVRTVTTQLDRMGKVAEAATHATGAGDGAVLGGGGGGGGRPPRAPGSGHYGRQGDVERVVRQMLLGGASTLGLGLGVGAGFADIQRWISRAGDFSSEALGVTLAGGAGTGASDRYTRMATLTGGAGFPSLVGPRDVNRIARELAARGVPVGGDLATMSALAGEVGLRGYGAAGAGAGLASQLMGTFRTDRVVELLSTVAVEAKGQGKNVGEMVTQLGALAQLFRGQGQFARSDRDLGLVRGLSRWLNNLPGDIGRGEGGAGIVQGLQAFSHGGIGQALALKAYMQATGGGPPSDAAGILAFRKWRENPANMAAVANQARRELGPTVGAIAIAQAGMPTAVAELLMQKEGTITEADIALLSRQAAAGAFGAENTALRGTAGGDTVASRQARERTDAQAGIALRLQNRLHQLQAERPLTMTGGAFGVGALSSLGLLRVLRGGAGGAAARWIAGRAAGVLGPLVGAGELGKDLYDLFAGGDPTNEQDLIGGLLGMVLGGGLGLAGGPGGVLAGAGWGYGLGKGGMQALEALVGGGSGPPAGARGITLPGRISPDDPRFGRIAARHGLPLGLLTSLASVESGFNPSARSKTDVRGLMQITKRTGRAYGLNARNFLDPEAQMEASAAYLEDLLHQTHDLSAALGMYHTGKPNDGSGYPAKVLGRMKDYAGFEAGGAMSGGDGGRWSGDLFIHLDPGLHVTANVPDGGVRVRVHQ